MSGKSSAPSTQTQVSEPWEGQQPYLKDLFSRAQDEMTRGGPQYFPGQTVAPRSQATLESERQLLATAGNMQGMVQGGTNYLQHLMGPGRDVSADPLLQSAIQSAMNPVIQNFQSVGGPLAQIRGHFTAGNSGGSGTREGIAQGVAQRSLGQTLADMSSSMTYAAHQDAQNRALQGASMLPGMMQASLLPGQTTAAVGADQNTYAQMLINAAMERHNWNQQLPWLNLQNYAQLVGQGVGGGTTSVTAPGTRTNPLLSGLGGAATGAGIASMMGKGAAFGPWGAAIGGGIGLLGSL